MNRYLRKMVIKSHVATNELSSPFYIKNQEFCKEFERYIGSKEGLIRRTYTSSGNLFLSAKKQCLRVTIT